MRKKRTSKKKMSTGAKVAVGVAVIGGGYLAWEYLVKPMLNKDKPEEPKTPQESEQQATAVIQAVQQIPVNTAPVSNLSPIGTAPNKINWGAKIKYGDKGGEVQVIQKLFNAIAKIYGSYTIAEDGIFGNETLAKKRGNFGAVYTITPKQVYDKLQTVKSAAMIDAKKKEIIDNLPDWMK